MSIKSSAGTGSPLHWIKSSYSTNEDGGDCVEAAATPTTVHVRDSKRVHGPRLAFTHAAWTRFVARTHVNG